MTSLNWGFVAEKKMAEIAIENVEVEFQEFEFSVVDDVQADHIDKRSYVDRCFQDFTPEKGTSNKSVRRIYCEGNVEPKMRSNEVAVILGYKSQPAKGRKNPLAGENLLHISTPTGALRIPLDQAEKFGQYVISIARSADKNLKTKVSSQSNDNTEH